MFRKSRFGLVGMLVVMLLMLGLTPPLMGATKTAGQNIKYPCTGSVTQKAPLYSKASVNSSIIKYLPAGTRIPLTGVTGTMYKVKMTTGRIAYVSTKYVKIASTIKPTAAKPVTLTISAATSLTDALNEIQKLYKKEKPEVTLTLNYGSSGSLAQQIDQGAPVDVFLSAANKQMDDLEKKNLLTEGSRKVLLKNSLVLIAPKDSSRVKGFESLTDPEIKVIACGEPASVPAGKYAQECLTKMGLWEKLQPKLVLGKDVRQVLVYVESGNADAGFVYTTDALTSDKVKVIATANETNHSAIVYPAAIVKSSKNQAAARDFIAFLSGSKAQVIFVKYGFVVPK